MRDLAQRGIRRVARVIEPEVNLRARSRDGERKACEVTWLPKVRGSKHLCQRSVLTILDTRGNKIDCEAAQQLATAVLGSASLEVFGKVPTKQLRADELTELDLSYTGLGPAEAIVLAKLVAVSGVLTSLEIGGNDLNEEAALGIVRAVREQGKMKMLGLAACGIGASGAREDDRRLRACQRRR
jgi:hypothetical protein